MTGTEIQLEQQPTDVIGFAKTSLDYYIKIQEAKNIAELASKISALKQLSGYLGIAGALVGFVFSFFGTGPDPEILKLQEMIKET